MSASQVIADRFEIGDPEEDLLGRGGVGDVYRGRDLQTGQLVAVKALRPEVVTGDPDVVARFLREGEALRQLNHPNIVQMVDAVEEGGRQYLVIEYVRGGSLRDLLAERGALPIRRAVQIALDVADALTRAHRLGIVHRDLKPSNVLLAVDGTPRLTDFGIAQVAGGPGLTGADRAVGTVDYMSPEACNLEALDNRTDVWAFGVMLYEMLAGERPFRGESPVVTLTAILTRPPPDLARLCPDAPEELVDLVGRMLRKDRGQRIRSVRLVGAELEDVLLETGGADQPSLAGGRFAVPTPPTEASRHSLPARPTPTVERESIQVPPAPVELKGERRVVTLVQANVVGSTELLVEVGSEAWAEIIGDLLQVLASEVDRFGGEIARAQGDELVVHFGAKTAHEDDPERAVLASLAMQEAFAEYVSGRWAAGGVEEERRARVEYLSALGLQVTVNTGEAIVTGDGTVVGEATVTARCIGGAARPGVVLVGGSTYRLVGPMFEWELPDERTVQDAGGPVTLYCPLARKAGPGKGRGIEGLESPLVGREAEMEALRGALSQLRAGVGGIVTLVGEAGLGKSRLVAELGAEIDRLPGEGPSIRWVEGGCLSYSGSIAYWLWLDVLRDLLGVTAEDSPAAARDALRERVRELCPGQFEDVYPYMGRLMSLPLGAELETKLGYLHGENLKIGIYRAVETVVERTASHAPLVIACEDLHWADPTSLDLLERLLAGTDRVPVLFLCVFRPEMAHGCWRIKETAARLYPHRHVDLWLAPLRPAESGALVSHLLHVEDLPPALRERVLGRGEGNPFYVEEILRSMMDSGVIAYDEAGGRWRAAGEVTEFPVPDTLQGVLMSRVDRLPKGAKRVLQLASVIGRSFSHRVLAEIGANRVGDGSSAAGWDAQLRSHLVTLQREGMIRERARVPEVEYAFKHQLTLEAAYSSVLSRDRRILHRRVGEALERLYPERVEEQVGLLAHHWDRAGEPAKAVAYLRRAGERAAAAFANTEALAFLNRALELVTEEDLPQRYALTLAREGVYNVQGRREAQLQDLALLQQAVRALDDGGREATRRSAEVALREAHYAYGTGDRQRAAAAAEKALRLAEAARDVRLEATGYLRLGWARERHEGKVPHLERALSLARAAGHPIMEAESLRALGLAHQHRDPTLARTYFEQALRVYTAMGNRLGQGRVLNALASVSWSEGDYDGARHYLERGLLLCRETGNRFDEAYALDQLAQNSVGQGDYADAIRKREEALRIHREVGDRMGEYWALFGLGSLFDRLGDYDTASAHHKQALRVGRATGVRLGGVLALSGLLAHHRGEDEAAREYIQQSLLIDRESGIRSAQGLTLTFLGHSLAGLDRLADAVDAYQEALNIQRELNQTHRTVEALAGLARVALSQGDPTVALSYVGEILGYLEAHPTLAGTWEPLRVYLTCYRVLRAHGDPRAAQVLEAGHRLLQERAAKIDDEALRRSFLENVAAHRELVAEFARGH